MRQPSILLIPGITIHQEPICIMDLGDTGAHHGILQFGGGGVRERQAPEFTA